MKVYFYPQNGLRDRQLDTVRTWPRSEVVNLAAFDGSGGSQVSKNKALGRRLPIAWPQRIPLINLKRRPRLASPDTVVYVWGAVVATGPFIVDLDNPYALTGYNLPAMRMYRPLLRAILGSRRCVAIRCMSEACRHSLRELFGEQVSRKAQVCYPSSGMRVVPVVDRQPDSPCQFLFVSTQFEIKGGVALLRAFRQVLQAAPDARLDLVTHLPPEHAGLVQACNGAVTVHQASFSRQQIFDRFISRADVLLHPTYLDSFGMVALEALAAGLGLIVTDVYALPELVRNEWNGFVLPAPISIWDGYLPSPHYYRLGTIKERIRDTDTAGFEARLASAMTRFATDGPFRIAARHNSAQLFGERFQPKAQ